MKAFGLDMTNIKGGATGGVSGKVGTTLFGNEVGGQPTGEFANLLDILGGGTKTETPNLLEVLNAAKENPDALTKLPKEVLEFIGREFSFDGQTILNGEGKPIQVEDIMAKIKELKPEMLNLEAPTKEASKEAKLMEVRDLIKGHDLGLQKSSKNNQNIFSSGDEFVQAKESAKNLTGNQDIKKALMPQKMNGLNQYSKEAQTLDTNFLSNNVKVDVPEAAIGMTQFNGKNVEFGMEQMTGPAKVVDLSSVNPSNTTSLIDQVTKIIEQNNIKSADSMDVVVKHDDLGQFKIQISKNADTNQMDMKIISKERAAHNFFVENEGQLAKALNQNGIKLGSFKMALSSETLFTSNAEGGKDFSEGFSQNRQQGSSFGGRQGENSESQRRRQLWQAFKENAEYASA